MTTDLVQILIHTRVRSMRPITYDIPAPVIAFKLLLAFHMPVTPYLQLEECREQLRGAVAKGSSLQKQLLAKNTTIATQRGEGQRLQQQNEATVGALNTVRQECRDKQRIIASLQDKVKDYSGICCPEIRGVCISMTIDIYSMASLPPRLSSISTFTH